MIRSLSLRRATTTKRSAVTRTGSSTATSARNLNNDLLQTTSRQQHQQRQRRRKKGAGLHPLLLKDRFSSRKGSFRAFSSHASSSGHTDNDNDIDDANDGESSVAAASTSMPYLTSDISSTSTTSVLDPIQQPITDAFYLDDDDDDDDDDHNDNNSDDHNDEQQQQQQQQQPRTDAAYDDADKRPHFDATIDPDILRQRTAALAHENVPFGEFTPAMWHEAVHLLKRWTFNHRLATSPESVDQSFLLLDRLVLEQEVQKSHPLSLDILNTRLVRSMVYNWYQCVEKFHTYSTDHQALLRYEFTPMELLARLEDYSDRSDRLQFDTKCLNMIIAGANRCSVVGAAGEAGMISPRVAIPFAESLLDRMASNANHAPVSAHHLDSQQEQHHQEQQQQQQSTSGGEDHLFPHDMIQHGLLPMDDILGGGGGENDGRSLPPLGQYHRSHHQHNRKLPSTRPDLKTYTSLIVMFASHGLASRAEALLNRMYLDYKETGISWLKPDVAIFTAVMKAWSKSDDPNAPHRADAILKRMQELTECGVENLAPDRYAYVVVLSSWAKAAGQRQNNYSDTKPFVDRARELFSEMETLDFAETQGYNAMMDVFGKARDPISASELLARMHEKYADGNERVQPTSVTYNTLLSAWARSGDPKCGDHAEAILQDFNERHAAGDVEDAPDLITYNSVLSCLAAAKQGDRAENLLQEMKKVQRANNQNISPDRVSFNIVINAHAEAKNPRAAEALLETMYQEYSALQGKKTHLEPTVTTFSTVLKAWWKSKEAHAAVRADAILRTMQKLDDANILKVAPNVISYNIMLSCWCQSQHPRAPKQAMEILTQMETLFNGGNSSVRPDEQCYDSVIRVFCNKFALQQADDLLERMHLQSLPTAMGGMGNVRAKPLARSYKRVMGSCSRSDDPSAGQRAESLWNRWQQRFESSLVEEGPAEIATQLVLDAHLNSRAPNKHTPTRAKAFLEQAQHKFESGDTPVAPRLKAHITLLEIYAKHKDPVSAHDYFVLMCGQCIKDNESNWKPSIEVLNLVLAMWRTSGLPDAAVKSEELLQKTQELVQAGAIDWKPNPASYRSYLNCLEAQPSMESGSKANAVLQEMEDLYASGGDGGDEQMKPQPRDFVQIMRIWCKTKDPASLSFADAAFQSMIDHDFVPNPNAFKTIITTLSNSNDLAWSDRITNLREEFAKAHDEQKN